MDEQVLNLRESLHIIRRYPWLLVALALVGLLGGLAYTLVSPAMDSATALVELPPSPLQPGSDVPTRDIATEVAIATTQGVLDPAARSIGLHLGYSTLQRRVGVTALTDDVVQITAQGSTPRAAEALANAVAAQFIAYKGTGAPGTVIEQNATTATHPSSLRYPELMVVGGLAGLVIAAIVAFVLGRRDRRLRRRDDIASAVQAPVLQSLTPQQRKTPEQWVELFDGWQPAVAEKARLHGLLSDLDIPSSREGLQPASSPRVASRGSRGGATAAAAARGPEVTVLTLAGDDSALAVAPELASFAAALGLPVVFVVADDHDSTAKLRQACAKRASEPPDPWNLVTYDSPPDVKQKRHALHVTLVVVDPESADMVDWRPAPASGSSSTSTVLAVSSGFAVAEELEVIASGAVRLQQTLAGVVVVNPEPTDRTTGRPPRLGSLHTPRRINETKNSVR